MIKIYAALVLSLALVKALEFVIGYTSAIAFPVAFFDIFGARYGAFLVNIFTITLPFFLISLCLLPLLGILAGAKTIYYATLTMAGVFVILVWESPGFGYFAGGWLLALSQVISLLSILLAAWLVGKRYTGLLAKSV